MHALASRAAPASMRRLSVADLCDPDSLRVRQSADFRLYALQSGKQRIRDGHARLVVRFVPATHLHLVHNRQLTGGEAARAVWEAVGFANARKMKIAQELFSPREGSNAHEAVRTILQRCKISHHLATFKKSLRARELVPDPIAAAVTCDCERESRLEKQCRSHRKVVKSRCFPIPTRANCYMVVSVSLPEVFCSLPPCDCYESNCCFRSTFSDLLGRTALKKLSQSAKMTFRNKGLSLSDQVDSALNDLFNLDSLTAQIKAVVSGHEHTVELLVALQARKRGKQARAFAQRATDSSQQLHLLLPPELAPQTSINLYSTPT